MKVLQLLALAALALLPIPVFADSVAADVPLVTVSEGGGAFFKMVPGKYHFKTRKGGWTGSHSELLTGLPMMESLSSFGKRKDGMRLGYFFPMMGSIW